MAYRRFAGGWRHKKRVEHTSTQAHDGHFCINAAGKIQPHLDVNKTLFPHFSSSVKKKICTERMIA